MNSIDTVKWDPAQRPFGRIIVEPQHALWGRRRGDWVVVPSPDEADLWRIVAVDLEAVRRSREIVTAFLGPGVAVLAHSAIEGIFEFEEQPSCSVKMVDLRLTDSKLGIEMLQRMVQVRISEPKRETGNAVSLSQVVRDFRLALRDRDGERAERLLERLRNDGRLSRDNLDFLHIEFLGQLGRWRELRDIPWFIQLAQARRPTGVTELMLEALWRIDFTEEGYASSTEALDGYRRVPDLLFELIDCIDVPTLSGALKVAGLRAIDQGSEARLERIRANASAADLSWVDGLSAAEDQVVGLESGSLAQRLNEDGRYVDVIDLALRQPDDVSILSVAIFAVAELDDAARAMQIQELLTPETLAAMPSTRSFSHALERLNELASDTCESWPAWFERVSGEEWPSALEVVRRDAAKWNASVLGSRAVAEECAQAIDRALTGRNSEAVEQAMDLLCELTVELLGVPAATKFVDTILIALAVQSPSEAACGAFVGLVQAVFDQGPTKSRYSDLVEVCTGAEHILATRSLIPVTLDLLDEFAAHPSPDADGRKRFASAAFAALQGHLSRGNLDAVDAQLGTDLFREMGFEDFVLEVQVFGEANQALTENDPWCILSGETVFLYTLMNALGQRFADRLQSLCPTVEVISRSDKACSDGLKAAVIGARFVIVDTRHASHAATGCIDEALAKRHQLFPTGKGVSSFLRCLAEKLQVA